MKCKGKYFIIEIDDRQVTVRCKHGAVATIVMVFPLDQLDDFINTVDGLALEMENEDGDAWEEDE